MDPNVGTSLVGGIQDISAFLPIIGTEQCERHVGEALAGGFFYAAATPLSLFGSLGIVKAGVAIFCASFSSRLAQMFAHSGFNLEGSIAAKIGRVPQERAAKDRPKKNTKSGATKQRFTWFRSQKEKAAEGAATKTTEDGSQYVAGRDFLKLIEDQHIDASKVELEFDYSEWNISLCFWTVILASFGIAPYIPIKLQDDQNLPPTWAYPPNAHCWIGYASRGFFSWLMSSSRLACRQLRQDSKKAPNASDPKPNKSTSGSWLPVRVQKLLGRGLQQQDTEKGDAHCMPHSLDDSTDDTGALPVLRGLQILLLLGVMSTAVGYLGCFTVVQRATTNNTYIWLATEVVLSFIRICIWGANPDWDEETGLRLVFKLMDTPPTITTGDDFEEEIMSNFHHLRQSFVALNDSQFLGYLAAYTGPLERFSDYDHHIAIYYTLTASHRNSDTGDAQKLLTTVLDLGTQEAYVFVHCCPAAHSETEVFSSIIEDEELRELMTLKIDSMLREKHGTNHFLKIDKHSRAIADRIGGIGLLAELRFSWALEPLRDTTHPDTPAPTRTHHMDHQYIDLQNLARDCRLVFYREQQRRIREYTALVLERSRSHPDPNIDELVVRFIAALDFLLINESASFEKALLQKTEQDGMTNNPGYALGRWLEVKKAWLCRRIGSAERIEKYRKAHTLNFDAIELLVEPPTDIDDDKIFDQILVHHSKPPQTCYPWIQEMWRHEKEQIARRLQVWERISPNSMNRNIFCAIFEAYPAQTDRESLVIMVERGCTVFDLSVIDRCDPLEIKITEIAGVQILNTKLDIGPIDSNHMNRLSPPIPEEAARSWFQFPPNSSLMGNSVWLYHCDSDNDLAHDSDNIGFLVVDTEQAGRFRVNLWWEYDDKVQVKWTLGKTHGTQTFEAYPRDLIWRDAFEALGKTPEIYSSADYFDGPFRHDTFTVDLPTIGTHKIDIEFVMLPDCGIHLRRVWVSESADKTALRVVCNDT
ncbi:hypothetical protein MVEN_00117500 [Mycena venus]|uniref:Uncharacterized protein n=1 Tax=Mycena venus TaxID=2733690 RepID=A0A8H7DIH7_9AGAR|nr:hypothetical protein MVEN_00117500 [Mycena venus]